jgi:hypothetical protein
MRSKSHHEEAVMRKPTLCALICTLGFVTLLGTGPAFAEVVIKGGIDVSGKLEVAGAKKDVEQSYSAAVEFTKPVVKFLHLGAGVEGQLPRSTEGGTGTFFFIPVYAVGRAQIPLGMFTPYATARVGYNFFFGDDAYKGAGGKLKGGINYGFGAGVVLFKFLLAEGSYSVYNGVHEWLGSDFDTTYSTFSLKAGVKF